jgi:hypothetical protein
VLYQHDSPCTRKPAPVTSGWLDANLPIAVAEGVTIVTVCSESGTAFTRHSMELSVTISYAIASTMIAPLHKHASCNMFSAVLPTFLLPRRCDRSISSARHRHVFPRRPSSHIASSRSASSYVFPCLLESLVKSARNLILDNVLRSVRDETLL